MWWSSASGSQDPWAPVALQHANELPVVRLAALREMRGEHDMGLVNRAVERRSAIPHPVVVDTESPFPALPIRMKNPRN
jgi:hypothetical protein